MKKSKLSLKIGITVISVSVLVIILFSWFSHNVTPKLIHISEKNINKYIEHIASDFKLFILEKNASDQFLKIKENQKQEIIGIDYDMPKIYELADKLTTSIDENIKDANAIKKYLEKKSPFTSLEEGLLLSYPIGIVTNSVFLANLGPKIPVLIKFIPSVFSNVKSRVKDYGINNALLEVYLEITINYEILTPVTFEEKKIQYELLLDSKIIQGSIPNIYGGLMENRSAFFEVPF